MPNTNLYADLVKFTEYLARRYDEKGGALLSKEECEALTDLENLCNDIMYTDYNHRKIKAVINGERIKED